MIELPHYIKNVEKHVLSTLNLSFLRNGVEEFLDGKTFTIVWSEGDIDVQTGKIKFSKKIYETKQGFYLYLLLNQEIPSMVVYYKQEQINELKIFISQLLKQFNNDKTINK